MRSPSPPSAPLRRSRQSRPCRFEIAFQGQTDPRQNHVHVVGADGSLTYGTILLTSSFELEGVPVDAEVIGTSFYADGTGPFTGALTLTYPNGDELGFRFDAIVQPAGEGTTVLGSVHVYGGTGVLADVTGAGTDVRRPLGPVGHPGRLRLHVRPGGPARTRGGGARDGGRSRRTPTRPAWS